MSATDGSTRLLVDTSIFARLGLYPSITAKFSQVIERVSVRQLLLCPPVAAEVGFMARDPRQHTNFIRSLNEYAACPVSPTSKGVLDIQHALWTRGLLRAAGATDTVIAAYAIANDAAVLHYDSDFEHIAAAVPEFQHHWIVPRGSDG